jgi:hypothetical protein
MTTLRKTLFWSVLVLATFRVPLAFEGGTNGTANMALLLAALALAAITNPYRRTGGGD